MEQAARLWGELMSGMALLWAGLKTLWIDLTGDAPFAAVGQMLREMRAEQGLVLIGLLGLLLGWRLLRRLKAVDRLEVYAERLDIRAEGLSAEMAELHNQLLEYQQRTRLAAEPSARALPETARVAPQTAPAAGLIAADPVHVPEPTAAARPAVVASAERVEPFLPGGRVAEPPPAPSPILPQPPSGPPPFPPGLPDFLRPYAPPNTPDGNGPHRLSSVLPQGLRADRTEDQNR